MSDKKRKIELASNNPQPIQRGGHSVEALIDEAAANWFFWAVNDVEGRHEEAEQYKKRALAINAVRVGRQRREGTPRSLRRVK